MILWNVNASYDEPLTHLRNIYVTEETAYVKTSKFVSANQTAEENNTDIRQQVNVENVSKDKRKGRYMVYISSY